jgi:ABC-type cobalamin/Fe3+-siderophores transport system ATPase subunit
VLRVEHLRVGTLPPLSFAVPAGECLSIEGPSGSGKTRLLRAIADLDPAEGHVFLDGAECREMPGPRWRRQVRYMAAEPGWWAPTPRAHMPPSPRPDRLDRLVRALGLQVAILDRPVPELSTGERQRLALIRAILDEPRVLLLDEPTAALDIGHQQEVLDLVDELRTTERGLTVLATMHDLSVAGEYADRLVLLAGGRVVATGTPVEVLTEEMLSKHYSARVRVIPGDHGPIVVPSR